MTSLNEQMMLEFISKQGAELAELRAERDALREENDQAEEDLNGHLHNYEVSARQLVGALSEARRQRDDYQSELIQRTNQRDSWRAQAEAAQRALDLRPSI